MTATPEQPTSYAEYDCGCDGVSYHLVRHKVVGDVNGEVKMA